MRSFFATFRMGFKFLWRSPISVSVLIVFPILLILVLGNALSAYISVDTELEPARVAAAAESGGELEAFLQSPDIVRFLDVTFTDRGTAEELLANGECVAVIYEQYGIVSVKLTPGGGMYADLTMSIIDSYRQIGAAAAIAATQGKDISQILGVEIGVEDKPLGKRVPKAIDYYAVTMLVLILMYTGLNGSDLFNKSLLSETGIRVRLSPVSKPVLTGGLLAASAVTSYLQGMVTFIFSGVVYGVYWGERIPLVLLTLFGVVLFSQSLCLFLTMLFRNPGAAAGTTQVLIWLMCFVSDGYSKISFGAAEKIFQYAPNAMAHTVIFGAVYGGNESKMMLDLSLLFCSGAALFIFAFLLGRRRLV